SCCTLFYKIHTKCQHLILLWGLLIIITLYHLCIMRYIALNKNETVFKYVAKAILLSLFSMATVCCNQNNSSYKKEMYLKYTAATIADSIFEEIHNQVYDNPSLARSRSFDILASLDSSDKISRIKLMKYIGSSYVFETNYPEAIKY